MSLKKKVTELRMVEKNGILVPANLATEAGVGCDTHDDHELIPMSFGPEKLGELVTKFLAKHQNCRTIVTLEKHGNRLFVTGKLVLKESTPA